MSPTRGAVREDSVLTLNQALARYDEADEACGGEHTGPGYRLHEERRRTATLEVIRVARLLCEQTRPPQGDSSPDTAREQPAHPVGALIPEIDVLNTPGLSEHADKAIQQTWWTLREAQKGLNRATYTEWENAIRNRFGLAGMAWCSAHLTAAPGRFAEAGNLSSESAAIRKQFFEKAFPGQESLFLGSTRSCWLGAAWWLWSHPDLLNA